MISGTGQNVENSSSGVALTGFLEIPSIAELLSGTEEFEGNHEVRLSRERYEKRQKLITSRKRPVKARNVSACKHWLSGLLKCSVCGATLSYTGNNKCPYFQCWKYAKGFHKTSVALSVKKAEDAVITYFDQILDGAEFTYVCKKKRLIIHCRLISYKERSVSSP